MFLAGRNQTRNLPAVHINASAFPPVGERMKLCSELYRVLQGSLTKLSGFRSVSADHEAMDKSG